MNNKPENGERVFYIRDANRNPVGVVAYSTEYDPVSGNPSVVYFGTSFLHPNDDFNKVRGRQIALGRLRGHPDHVHVHTATPLASALLGVISSDATPRRIKKLLWSRAVPFWAPADW